MWYKLDSRLKLKELCALALEIHEGHGFTGMLCPTKIKFLTILGNGCQIIGIPRVWHSAHIQQSIGTFDTLFSLLLCTLAVIKRMIVHKMHIRKKKENAHQKSKNWMSTESQFECFSKWRNFWILKTSMSILLACFKAHGMYLVNIVQRVETPSTL